MKLLNNKKESDQELNVDVPRRALTTAVWLTPVITTVALPAHAQTSEIGPFTAGTYDISFSNGGSQTTVNCTGSNDGNTLTIGVIDFEAEIASDGSITADQAVDIFGIGVLPNAVDSSGVIDFNGSFDFVDDVLGMCTTELTITGNIVGSELSGVLIIETTCDGCLAMQESSFSGALI